MLWPFSNWELKDYGNGEIVIFHRFLDVVKGTAKVKLSSSASSSASSSRKDPADEQDQENVQVCLASELAFSSKLILIGCLNFG